MAGFASGRCFSSNSGMQVLENRAGIPITLALVYMEVAARVGFGMVGLNVPGAHTDFHAAFANCVVASKSPQPTSGRCGVLCAGHFMITPKVRHLGQLL